MIRSAALRLTLFYLLIIMALSISFSFAIYHVSDREIRHDFPQSAQLAPEFGQFDTFGFNTFRQETLLQNEHNLQRNLLVLNVVTLVLGAFISYGLARRTLQPIGEAFEAQGRFTADASHELRTPLTAMQTSIEVGLRDPKLNFTKSKELLSSTLEEVQKLSALANGLLKLTRSGNQDMPKEPVLLATVAKRAVSQLEGAAKAKAVVVSNNVGKETVRGDAVSLTEVLAILLDNAIKYSHEKGPVTLSSRSVGKYAYLTVSDEGQGIKASDLVHIFDRFYRADNARSRTGIEGYGLGLPIAKKIVEAHGGSVEASSTVGKGSKFVVKLPLNVSISADS